MNITLNKLAFDVLEMYRANLKDTDSVDIRQVVYWINSARAFLIKQRLDRNIFNIYEEELQTISPLGILPVSGSTSIVYTSSEIPATISRKGHAGTLTKVWYPFNSLTAPYTSTYPVQIVPFQRFERVGNRKFNGNLHYAAISSDRKLYIKSYTFTGGIDQTKVEGVFQDPIEVMTLNSESDPYNADYPLNSSLIRDLINLIVSEKFQIILKQSEDHIGEDGRDTTTVA